MKFKIKDKITGKILFSLETESFSLCAEAAIKQKANLRYADLSYADLSCVNLSYTDLSYADLSCVNLRNANLRNANLRNANLRNADLRYADLRNADLSYADLSYAKTDKRYIQVSCIGSRKSMTTYCFDDDKIWCGCFSGTLDDFEKRVNKTHKENHQYLKEYTAFITMVRSLK